MQVPKNSFKQKILPYIYLCLVIVIALEILLISYNEHYQSFVNNLRSEHLETIEEKEKKAAVLAQSKDLLDEEVERLNAQVAGLMTTADNPFPFMVPSTGTVGSKISTYLNNHQGALHYGVDIWTSTEKGGAISTHRGNPVYSACDGVVVSFQPDNGGVTISCDRIPDTFKVPAHKVYTYYGHMANADTKEQYILLKLGERVKKGQFIGYQGDLSMFTPEMRNVHLHFSVFIGPRERDGAQDPCKYIGGSCTQVGQFMVAELGR